MVGAPVFGSRRANALGKASSNPAAKFLGMDLFVFVGFVILTALAWITRSTIEHHFGINLFPFV